MKKPKWEEGSKGAMWKGAKMITADSPVISGMTVTAQCKGEIIRLHIIEETEPRIFKASIMGYYFLNESDALNDGDLVSIDREHILWLHGKD